MTGRRGGYRARLLIDPIACEAVGLCAYLAPDVVGLDRWGYPVGPTTELGSSDVRQARRAVRACPRRALHLVDADESRDGV